MSQNPERRYPRDTPLKDFGTSDYKREGGRASDVNSIPSVERREITAAINLAKRQGLSTVGALEDALSKGAKLEV